MHPPGLPLVPWLMARRLLIASLILVARGAFAEAPLDDARLGAAASEVHAIVDQAGRDGLPADLVADKVREGLAKGVPPARIVVVLRGLARALVTARSEAQPFAGAAPPRGLLKAIVEAHAGGAGAKDVDTVLRAGGRERAIGVLTDLVQRGYPAAAAAHTVAAVSGRGGALDRLVGQAERLRTVGGASGAEALDALERAEARGFGLDHAEQLLHHGEPDDGTRGPNRETSGTRGPRSGGVAPPGRGR